MTVTATPSLRYKLIHDDAVREYKNGRQVCCDTVKGQAIYKQRTAAMQLRQHNVCSRGNHLIVNPTFDHSTRGRGMGAAFRDDRIEDENGEPINSCSCFYCNGKAGSVRLK